MYYTSILKEYPIRTGGGVFLALSIRGRAAWPVPLTDVFAPNLSRARGVDAICSTPPAHPTVASYCDARLRRKMKHRLSVRDLDAHDTLFRLKEKRAARGPGPGPPPGADRCDPRPRPPPPPPPPPRRTQRAPPHDYLHIPNKKPKD
ncbi:unnamed protein product, partial [Iphiclides podalirius]